MNLFLNELSPELLGILTRPKQKNSRTKPNIFEKQSSFSCADIQDMLLYLNPDMSYDDWVKVGMAVHAGGYDMSLWDAWSMRGSKYDAGECKNKWNGFDGGGLAFH